jgi:hypothetical protein
VASIGTSGPVPAKYQREFEAAAGLGAAGPHQLRWESDLGTSAVAMVCGCGLRLEEDILARRSSEHVLFQELAGRMAAAHRELPNAQAAPLVPSPTVPSETDPSGYLFAARRAGFRVVVSEDADGPSGSEDGP